MNLSSDKTENFELERFEPVSTAAGQNNIDFTLAAGGTIGAVENADPNAEVQTNDDAEKKTLP